MKKNIFAIVERIEDGIISLELDNNTTLNLYEKQYNNIKEGDVLSLSLDDDNNIISVSIDEKETAYRKNCAKKRLSDLFSKNKKHSL